jgi:hypothetical protein
MGGGRHQQHDRVSHLPAPTAFLTQAEGRHSMENSMGNAERPGAWRQLWDEDRLLLLRLAFWSVLVVTFSVLRGKWLLKGWRHRFFD